jgi:hypothetical protein
MFLWAIGEFGRGKLCTNLSTNKSNVIFGISGPNYIGQKKKLAEMKNKIFLLIYFPSRISL